MIVICLTCALFCLVDGQVSLPPSTGSGGGVWGSITGTLSSQGDLNTALGLKAPLTSPTFTGTVTVPLFAGPVEVLKNGAQSIVKISSDTQANLSFNSGSTAQIENLLGAPLYITNDAATDIIFRTSGAEKIRFTSGGGITLTIIKATTGSRTLCVDSSGVVTAVAGACPAGT